MDSMQFVFILVLFTDDVNVFILILFFGMNYDVTTKNEKAFYEYRKEAPVKFMRTKIHSLQFLHFSFRFHPVCPDRDPKRSISAHFLYSPFSLNTEGEEPKEKRY